ncbi:MAG: hypothetical protein H7338_01085 [Candidatus Sericytochromatia bacterium]|nr:hypothetical protein [Candidatus Sericytochromatia bacterium]
MHIGRVVKSNSHTDYVCRIYDAADRVPAPQPADFPFAGFVRVGDAVGVIYRSELVNPDYGFQGPRLSATEAVRSIITPDLINEQATLVGILLLGEETGGQMRQGVPRRVVPVHTEVTSLDDGAFLAFHHGPAATLQLSYYPLLLAQAGPMGHPLLLTILDRLEGLAIPEEAALVSVLRTTVSWQATLAST